MTADRGADRPARDPWAVPDVPILARSAHDRIAHRRTDEDWLAAVWKDPASRVLQLSRTGTTPVLSGGRALRFVAPAEAAPDGVRVLLGAAGGTVYLATLGDQDGAAPDWRGLRELATELTDLEVGLLTIAVALQAWHQSHRHCARCGAVTEVSKAGWSRTCPVDSSEHFPRTDPAVIVLVHDGAGRCVLARGPQWPAGRMSVLAGFVEAGESAEAAIVREVREEVGIQVCDVAYVASQPHPFPASLMLGYTARVTGDPRLVIDADEIVEAGWYTREEVRRTTDWGAEPVADAGSTSHPLPALRGLPGAMSIARQLINAWLLAED
ncbi:MAG TPA: NAD(+) diphosphatase [Jatrophihabitans sp.]|uniref:NAD(+) diphosphatase n=1 Tax=Jatrophihabitans sp. TaxID=1932789 RepID=UPI002F21C411